MYHRSSNYDNDYDNRGSSWTRGFGIGMGYSGGAGEAKKGETSERIGDFHDYNRGFSSNYGAGSNYTYGDRYPGYHALGRDVNTWGPEYRTYERSSNYPTYGQEYQHVNRYNTTYPTWARDVHTTYPDSYNVNRFSHHDYDNNRYSGYAHTNPTGYRTVHETREIVRDSDRPFGHSVHYNRDYNTGSNYGTSDRHYSQYGRY